MNGAYVAVKDSDLEGFREVGADNQAIAAYNTTGHLQIVDNYIEAAGENVLFGGADSASPALVPGDIEIRGNYLFKPLSLLGGPFVVKNLVEFKAASRVLLESNVLQNNWLAAQNGFSVLLTPRNQDGTAPWSIVQDVTISDNLMLNLGSGLNILDTDNIYTSLDTARVLVQNNVIVVTGINGANGWAFEVTGNPTSLTIDHNTIFDVNAFLFAVSLPQATEFTFTNNIVQNGTYGLIGQATAPGNSSLQTFFLNPTFTDNAIIGGLAYLYPSGNSFPADTSAVQFVDAAGGNYSLSPSSPYVGAGTDGRDLGADESRLPTLNAATVSAPSPTPPGNPVRK